MRAIKGGRNTPDAESTTPHQILLEDVGSGRVLKRSGSVQLGTTRTRRTTSTDGHRNGMSIFEMVIQHRDDLVRGDQELWAGETWGFSTWRWTMFCGIRRRWAPSRTAWTSSPSARNTTSRTCWHALEDRGHRHPRVRHEFQVAGVGAPVRLAVGAKSIRPTLMDFLR